MWRRLLPLSFAEWRHHPWRHGVALLAVALGVALASSVQIINASALAEFGQALRSVNGEPDAVLAATQREGFDEALLDVLSADERVAALSPVLALDGLARVPAGSRSDVTGESGSAGASTGAARESGASSASDTPSDIEPAKVASAPGRANRSEVRIIGIDALQVARLAPGLMLVLPSSPAASTAGTGTGTGTGTDTSTSSSSNPLTTLLDPSAAWLNPAARRRLGLREGDAIELQTPHGWQRLRVAGAVAAAGAPLVVLDIAAAQAHFGREGRLSRIDVRLVAGVDRSAWLGSLALPAGVRVAAADDGLQRMSNLSRAYRVNLGVLALVALLVGGFLVYSVSTLSLAQRLPGLALLGVLGLAARERRAWILAESALLGLAGSVIGLMAGAGLAALALQWLGGDLGGRVFTGMAPALSWPLPALAACAVLGVASAMAGAWWPARQAEAMAPAMVLKGQGSAPAASAGSAWHWPMALAAGGVLLARLPPVAGMPLAAYASVAMLLGAGVASVPVLVQVLMGLGSGRTAAVDGPRTDGVAGAAASDGPRTDGGAGSAVIADAAAKSGAAAVKTPATPVLLWLAWRRAGFARQAASAAVAGVVASLALSVALTVMVASFREAVSVWLDQVLPADLYVRNAGGAAVAEQAGLLAGLVEAAGRLTGVVRVQPGRWLAMSISPDQAAVALLARPLDDPLRQLPMVDAPVGKAAAADEAVGAAAMAGTAARTSTESNAPTASSHQATARIQGHTKAAELPIFISEGAAAIYGWRVGQRIHLPLPGGPQPARVQGVFRDYARQFGSVAVDLATYQAATGDRLVNDLALWLAPTATVADVSAALKRLAGRDHPLEVVGIQELRRLSLAIFDRSFAVTRYLQAVAIAVGLIGVAASLSAQVLARRKEFGLLAHLGLTRRQCVALVSIETAAWLLAGCLIGVALGLAIAVVLVHVVNPQSFHWTMAMRPPWAQLLALAAGVWAAGAATAAFSARRAASAQAVLAVKEDW